MSGRIPTFAEAFLALTGYAPMRWQRRLFDEFVSGCMPKAVDLPTGLGKTSVIAIWLLARAVADDAVRPLLPRRLIYVVDRRAVVDQATDEAEKLRQALQGKGDHFEAMDEPTRTATLRCVAELKQALGVTGKAGLPISTLRGQHADNRAWLDDPAATAIIVGTVDMTGSRLLFGGYGVSRKMRPYHAGLIGADTLLVLDEAHLVPPFEGLVRAVEADETLRPADRGPVPRLVVLPLSATLGAQPSGKQGVRPFALDAEDREDGVAAVRLAARKTLRVETIATNDPDRQLAEAALALATQDGPRRVLVFCNRRDRKDEASAGPSAQGVAEAIRQLAGGDKKTGRERVDIEPPELLVGGRRVHERENAAKRLRELGFIGEANPPQKPAFVVATAAGEVGVDIDADHLVADLAPWERMVQRLGRVNRRGRGDATIVLFDTARLEKDDDARARLEATLALLRRAENLGPAMLAALKQSAGVEAIRAASTPEPLRPAVTRELVDAWSMTSLETHTGRPDIEPWLRGWVEDQPQTTLVWRKYLPVVLDDNRRPAMPAGKLVEAFFEAAPPHTSEMLETETYRALDWLEQRAKTAVAAARDRTVAQAKGGGDAADADAADVSGEEAAAAAGDKPLAWRDIVLMVLSPAGDFVRAYTLKALADAAEQRGRGRERLLRELRDKTLVLDARLGGLADSGLLDPRLAAAASAVDDQGADGGPKHAEWAQAAGFRVAQLVGQEGKIKREGPRRGWRFGFDLVRHEAGESDAADVLRVERFRGVVTAEETRSTASALQLLTAHQGLAAEKARRIGELVGLSGVALDALVTAARLHDEGKAVDRWQRAFNAPPERDASGKRRLYAKTPGPIDQGILAGYRHEFGSLAVIERHAEFRALPEDWRDLVLHLVAAHHGNGRPTIAVDGAADAPPSALADRARDVALRFARLQKRWGPWGLAWWEALLRAADQQASRDADIEDEGDAAAPEAANG